MLHERKGFPWKGSALGLVRTSSSSTAIRCTWATRHSLLNEIESDLERGL